MGTLKGVKAEEYRASMTPARVEVLKSHGHWLSVEKNAGSGFAGAFGLTGIPVDALFEPGK